MSPYPFNELPSITVSTVGFRDTNELTVLLPPASYGNIRNGVAFNNGGGVWMISFEDLEKIYHAVKKARNLS